MHDVSERILTTAEGASAPRRFVTLEGLRRMRTRNRARHYLQCGRHKSDLFVCQLDSGRGSPCSERT
eukprot:366012-Chlamydomonas_euryale.AAC.12